MKPIYLYGLGKRIINSCNTEAQLITAENWVRQIENFNPELAVVLSYELSEKYSKLIKLI